MKNVALIVAAGKGERAGGGVPKQFSIVAGKPIICHSVDAFLSFQAIDAVFVPIKARCWQMRWPGAK
jgi:2-C-methyl-D-erythritol 4-phosphate cytidylyltransferase / 2-C-methyl-D-erythritol 2,4-cyclodiphosphate synthase